MKMLQRLDVQMLILENLIDEIFEQRKHVYVQEPISRENIIP